jgi:hypothetical protein
MSLPSARYSLPPLFHRAFEKIADVKQGLAAIEWRRVPCDYRPSNPAPDGPTKMPPSEHPSRFGASGSPYAPDDLEDVYQQKLVMRFDSDGARQGGWAGICEGGEGMLCCARWVNAELAGLAKSCPLIVP